MPTIAGKLLELDSRLTLGGLKVATLYVGEGYEAGQKRETAVLFGAYAEQVEKAVNARLDAVGVFHHSEAGIVATVEGTWKTRAFKGHGGQETRAHELQATRVQLRSEDGAFNLDVVRPPKGAEAATTADLPPREERGQLSLF